MDMDQVILDVSMSLDGFIAGPNDKIEPLHDWLFKDPSPAGQALLEEALDATGAVVMGRRTFDLVDGPDGWTAPDGTAFALPVFVLTTEVREPVTKGVTSFTFVNDGIRSAVTMARSAAGGKDVAVMGANTTQQALQAGLLDELTIHLVPVLLGAGIRLFGDLDEDVTLVRTSLVEDPQVSHHRFRVVR